MNDVYTLLFKRALDERLEEHRKRAFVPMDAKTGQQAAGPGGAPVDPMAAAGGAPPPSGGMPPGGAPPGGAPPMDPMAAGGAPPPGGAPPGGDPLAALGGLLEGAPGGGGAPPPIPEEEPPPGAGGEDGDTQITKTDADTFQTIQKNTMDIVRQTLEMVGKAKPREEQEAETAANVSKLQGDAAAAAPPTPGPVTGQPVNTEAAEKIQGPLKMGSAKTSAIIARLVKRAVEGSKDGNKTGMRPVPRKKPTWTPGPPQPAPAGAYTPDVAAKTERVGRGDAMGWFTRVTKTGSAWLAEVVQRHKEK